jgi:NADH-quinone oxidoreductase subunit J
MTLGDLFTLLFVAIGGTGTFLLLPHRHGASVPRKLHLIGAIAAAVAIVGFLFSWTPPAEFLSALFFYVFSLSALVAGLLMVTARNPIYSALWFACVVLSTSGLFILAGAQFVAAGTIIVYAGAIIVTFLFVIMLAQMEGRADYDRAARSPALATFTCSLLLWCLIYSLGTLATSSTSLAYTRNNSSASEKALPRTRDLLPLYRVPETSSLAEVLRRADRQTSRTNDTSGEQKPNVAGLGESLYTDHLITVGFSGILLFAALIGAVAITNPKRPSPFGSGSDPAQKNH